MITLRIVQKEEADTAMAFINGAKEHLKQQGINQWQNGYPDFDCILQDIENENGYFLVDGQEVFGYLCIDFNGEPAYHSLRGKWQADIAYATVHRLSVGSKYRGKGLAVIVFGLVEELCRQKGVHSIRIDTSAGNTKMRHIIEKSGFEYCGIIWYDDGERIAFEKLF